MSDWETAYEEWLQDHEDFLDIFTQARRMEETDNPEGAADTRNLALALLSELALNFFRQDPPDDKCGLYKQALFEIGAVVGEHFPDDIDGLFRDRVIEVFDQCAFEQAPREDDESLGKLSSVPFGSRWRIEIEKIRDHDYGMEGNRHTREVFELTIRIPNPSLSEILGTKILFDAAVQAWGGFPAAYDYFKGNFIKLVDRNLCITVRLTDGGFVTEKTPATGTWTSWEDPSSGVLRETPTHKTTYQTSGCPRYSVNCEYDLSFVLLKFFEKPDSLNIGGEISSHETLPHLEKTTTTTTTNPDGTITKETWKGPCFSPPPLRGSWKLEEIPLAEGTHIMDELKERDQYHLTKVTLERIENR